jgi:hypothetical protein
MARITQISDAAATPEAAAFFAAIKGKIGMVPNLFRVTATDIDFPAHKARAA